jgi:hypothetical protein
MKTSTFLFGACALLIVPMGSAVAGPCATEIDSLTKLMAARDAGAGPTAGAAGAPVNNIPPTATMGAADPSTAASSTAAQSARPQHPPTAVMNEATQGGASAQVGSTAQAQHPPTAAMNQATQGGAASPQDAQSQTRGGPTAVQQAEGARQRPVSENLASAQAALEQARSYDRAGQEAQCMDAITRAKQFAR